ncbi:hypothetical protein MTO96_010594 [Rhipicephalus appendiculatus]
MKRTPLTTAALELFTSEAKATAAKARLSGPSRHGLLFMLHRSSVTKMERSRVSSSTLPVSLVARRFRRCGAKWDQPKVLRALPHPSAKVPRCPAKTEKVCRPGM